MFSLTNALCRCVWACIMWYLVLQSFDNENDWLLVARLLFHSVIGHFDWNSIKNKRSSSVAASQYFVWDCVDLQGLKRLMKTDCFSSLSLPLFVSLFQTNRITGACSPSVICLMIWISMLAGTLSSVTTQKHTTVKLILKVHGCYARKCWQLLLPSL